MTKRGFIKLQRQVQDHWLYDEKRTFSKFEAWIDILLSANHKDNKVVLGNELITVKRGGYVTSIKKLGDHWGWSNTKVNAFLQLLTDDEMINFEKDTKKTIINVVNYSLHHDAPGTAIEAEKQESKNTRQKDATNAEAKPFAEGSENAKAYQHFEDEAEDVRKKHSKNTWQKDATNGELAATVEGTEIAKTHQKHIKSISKAYQKHTDKNVKNVKKEDINISRKYKDCDEQNALHLFARIKENNPTAKDPNFNKWADDMRKIRELDKRTNEQIIYLINWSQANDFWSSNILSPSKLRKQWDQLVMKAKNEHKSKKALQLGNGNNKGGIDFTSFAD